MRVLMIDDDPVSIKGVSDHCDEKGWDNRISDFESAYKQLLEFDPDAVVLDWYDDADRTVADPKETLGNSLLSLIWDRTFRPVIVFSGIAGTIEIDEKLKKCSMLKLLPKGEEDQVCLLLDKIEKVSNALSGFRSDMGAALIESLNGMDKLINLEDVTCDAAEYVLEKRMAAYFDEKFISSLPPSWVQYLCPPIDNCLNVCDILVKKTERVEELCNPESYLLVLTPSCDLYCGHGRAPKVSDVLCAHCCGKEKALDSGLLDNLDAISENKLNSRIEKIERNLHAGYHEHYVPLPKFADVIPYMSVDLKKIVLLHLEIIATREDNIDEKTGYVRVASVCSPFREQIVWAHLQNSCRPGVPDRNTRMWAKGLLGK